MSHTDPQSLEFLNRMSEQQKVNANRVAGVKSVLVVLSTSGMVFDMSALAQKIRVVYPEAKVFFLSTAGTSLSDESIPKSVDLLIDFTGPGQRSPFMLPRKLRSLAKVAIGRRAGLWRPYIYDRIFNDKARWKDMPKEKLARERLIQREVLALAGVALTQTGEPLPDRGKSIALELPPLKSLR